MVCHGIVLSVVIFGNKLFSFCRYISCGSETGNAYGLAAVCGVCFPFFFFVRLYAPISPVTNGVYFATISLVRELLSFSFKLRIFKDRYNRLLDTRTRMYN